MCFLFIFSETYSQSDILGLRWQFYIVMCQDCTSPLKLTYISCLLGFNLKCCETKVEIYKGRKDADPSFPLRRNDKQFHSINMLRGRMFGLLTQSVLCPETVVGRFVLTQKMSNRLPLCFGFFVRSVASTDVVHTHRSQYNVAKVRMTVKRLHGCPNSNCS